MVVGQILFTVLGVMQRTVVEIERELDLVQTQLHRMVEVTVVVYQLIRILILAQAMVVGQILSMVLGVM